jgi:hypothetical protein
MKCWCGGEAVDQRCLDSQYHDPTATGRPEAIRTLYIAGPMSGYPDCNYPAFQAAARTLEAVGFKTVDPSTFGTGRHYVDFIREDLAMLLECDAIATLDHWWESVGARNEVQVAGILKMPVRSVAEWVALAEEGS